MKAILLSRNDATRVEKLAPANGLLRLFMVVAMLTLGALAAQATIKGPKLTSVPTSLTVLENLTTNAITNLTIGVLETDTNLTATNVTISATSSDTNLVSDADLVITGSGASRTLTITPAYEQFGSTKITLVSTDTQPVSTTNTFILHVSLVDQPPTNTLSTNLLLVEEESKAQTIPSFLTGLSAGPSSQSSQTWKFIATTASGDPTNAIFTKAPEVSTNGTLTFAVKAHSYGTNLVTLVMVNSGGTANGGIDSYTNSFAIGVVQTNHVPNILKVSNVTVLENATNSVTVSVSVWDYDKNASNCVLTATSSNTNLETASITGTNVNATSNTNVVFTLTLTLVTNQFGVVTNQLIATEDGLSSTNTFKLTVSHVNQPPSFAFNTNVVVSNVFSSEEEILAVTNVGFLTNITTGPSDQSSETWKFVVTTAAKESTNAVFTVAPAISTNGTLTFRPKAHSYGTNLVKVVMIDSGGTANHGIDSCTNSFLLAIVQTNHAPTIVKVANQTMLENATNATVSISVWNYDKQASNFVLTATSGNTNLASLSVTATNVNSTNNTNTIFTVTMALVTNQFGIMTNQLVATENGLSTTNTFKLTVTHVNQHPSFAFNTNVVISNVFSSEEEILAVTNVGFVTNLLAGPTNESTETWKFTLTTAAGGTTNAVFTKLPAIATNGTLTFDPKAHSYGTNLVTVVMTDNGGLANHAIDSYTNTFLLAIVQTNHAPNFYTITNVTTYENTTNVTASINVWDYDQKSSNIVLTATSSNTNLESVSVGTNVSHPSLTNAVFTLGLTLASNQFGIVTNQLIATEGSLSTTNSIVVTVKFVNQPPSYTFDTNVLTSNVLSVAENVGVTNFAGFLTNLSVGPTNQAGQTWGFSFLTVTNGSSNATFTQLKAATNGTLTLQAATNSFGTNTVTVIMTNSGGSLNGGKNACTNTFQLEITQILYAPEFTGITNKSILENGTTNLTEAFTLYNHLNTNFTVTAVSSDTNLATVSVTGSGANRSLLFAPVTNQNGSNTITVTAVSGSLTNSTNLTLTVLPVNQPPSFDLAVSNVTVDNYDVAVAISNVVTNILAGPTNESGQTVSFTVTNSNSNLFHAGFSPAIDTNGTLTFTPGKSGGTVTVGIKAVDDGGTSNGGVNTSPVQTMTINIPTNTFQSVTGTFAGLFYDANIISNASSGYVSLVLASNGTFAGYLLGAGGSNAFSGQFDISNYYASVTTNSYTLDLTVDTSTNEVIGGSVSNTSSGWGAALQAYRAGYSASSPTSLAGVYLMAMPGSDDAASAPPGDSVFSITISSNGAVSMAGTLADDTAVAQNSQISQAGYYPLYAWPYTNGTSGSLIGWIGFNGNDSNSVSTNSGLTWFNLAGATTIYPSGFTNQGVPAASLYDSNLTSLLPYTSGLVILSGGNLETNLTNAVTITNNLITVTSATNTNSLILTIDHYSGAITGSFVDPSSSLTNAISGAILQGTNFCPGFFLGTNQGGEFILLGN